MSLSDNQLNNILEEALTSLFPGITADYSHETNSMPDLIDVSGSLWSTLVDDYQKNIRQYQENMTVILNISNRIFRPYETVIDIPIYRRDISTNIANFRPRSLIPTPLQVFQATEMFVYTETVHLICPISLEPFQDGESLCRIKECNHAFKQLELISWFSRNSHCPVCRYDICV